MVGLLCLAIYVEEQRPRTLFLGMVCLGLGVYSYLAFLAMTSFAAPPLTGFVLLRQRLHMLSVSNGGCGVRLALAAL